MAWRRKASGMRAMETEAAIIDRALVFRKYEQSLGDDLDLPRP